MRKTLSLCVFALAVVSSPSLFGQAASGTATIGGLVTDLTNPAFGQYNGGGIGPRTAQLTGRLVF